MQEENKYKCPYCGHINVRECSVKRIICDGCKKEFSEKPQFDGTRLAYPEVIATLRLSCGGHSISATNKVLEKLVASVEMETGIAVIEVNLRPNES